MSAWNEKLRKAALLLITSALTLAAHANNPVVLVSQVQEAEQGQPVRVNGLVRSRNDVLLPARSAGELMWSLEEGTKVAKGDVIAQVNSEQLELQLNEQKVAAERAEVNHRYLEREVKRLLELANRNLASETQLAEMTSRRDLANNDYKAAMTRIARLENSLQRTAIVSPINGIIVERLIEGGEFARVGDTVARIVDPAALEISAAIPVLNLNRIDYGANVMVTLPDLQFSASIRSVINAGDQRSQTFDVIIDIPLELAANIVSGQFVEVDVPLQRSHSLYVPRDAVVLRSDGSYVFRITSENVAERVKVVLGEGYGKLVSVHTPDRELAIGDRVAVRGVEMLRDGQAVEPRPS